MPPMSAVCQPNASQQPALDHLAERVGVADEELRGHAAAEVERVGGVDD
jgi:hypothetical protein